MTGSIKDYTPNYKFILPRFDLATWHDYIETNFRSIDALFYNLFVVNQYKGMWENSTIYNVGDVVFIGEDGGSASEGKLYKVQIQHTTPASGTFSDYKTEYPTYYALYVESTIQVDAQLDTTSDRPVQNGAITTAIDLKANIADLSNVAFSGSYSDLTNKPSLSTVATSGSYNDLLNKPNLDNYALDSGAVHKIDAETIGGIKTFTSDPVIKNGTPMLYCNDSNQTKGTAPNADVWSAITFQDTNGNLMGRCRQLYNSDKKNTVGLQVYKANASSDADSATMGISYPASGDAYGFAPASDINNSILTTISKTKESKGYFWLGNGMLINWGKLTENNTNVETVNFSKAYTAIPCVFFARNSTNTSGLSSVENVFSTLAFNISTSSFKHQSDNFGSNVSIVWFAIGYRNS